MKQKKYYLLKFILLLCILLLICAILTYFAMKSFENGTGDAFESSFGDFYSSLWNLPFLDALGFYDIKSFVKSIAISYLIFLVIYLIKIAIFYFLNFPNKESSESLDKKDSKILSFIFLFLKTILQIFAVAFKSVFFVTRLFSSTTVDEYGDEIIEVPSFLEGLNTIVLIGFLFVLLLSFFVSVNALPFYIIIVLPNSAYVNFLRSKGYDVSGAWFFTIINCINLFISGYVFIQSLLIETELFKTHPELFDIPMSISVFYAFFKYFFILGIIVFYWLKVLENIYVVSKKVG